MIAVFCNADDYGRSKAVTDCINLCIDKGLIQSISLMCGGDDCQRAIDFLRKYPQIKATINLSLYNDIAPLADKSLIPDLISDKITDRLKFDLVKLWYALNISPKRKQIKEQIFIEFCAQIEFSSNNIYKD